MDLPNSNAKANTQSSAMHLRVVRIEQLVNQTKLFFLEPADKQPIVYKAGQYLTIIHPTHQPEARRSYSITSAPVLQEPLAIGVKRVANGLLSRFLYDTIKPGDLLITSGVGGMFTLTADTSKYKQVFLFAAGVGITPLFALLKEILHAHEMLKVVLVYSNSEPGKAIFKAEIEQLADQFTGRLVVQFLFSNSADLAQARLYPDLLISLLKRFAVGAPEELLCFICGPINYQRMCVYGLRRAGVPADQIRRENFVTTDPKPLSLPPDTEAHAVTIKTADREVRLTVKYPETILQAARKEGLPLPFSCEAGVCGNCTAKCLQGTVWMSYNEVLTTKDIENGLVLTCVSHPVGGEVVLEV